MKAYQDNKDGCRTSPEFERETEFFIPMGAVLLEFEVCSQGENRSAIRLADSKDEEYLSKESKMCHKSIEDSA